MVENVTPNRNYPEPAAANPLSFDVGRVVAALRAVDADIAGLIAALAAKAALASPAFEGTPTAPTPTAGDDSNRLATTAFIKAAIDALSAGSTYLVPSQNLADLEDEAEARANLDVMSASEVSVAIIAAINAVIASAPGALDTLNELAAALGNDANFATTVTTALAGKVAKAGDTMTGGLGAPFIELPAQAAPANPATGKGRLYIRSDGLIARRDSAGVETLLAADPTTTRGDLLFRGASGLQRLAKGAQGKILGAGADDPEWIDLPAGDIVAVLSTDFTTTSTSMQDVTGLSITLATGTYLVELEAIGRFQISSGTGRWRMDMGGGTSTLTMAGATEGANDGGAYNMVLISSRTDEIAPATYTPGTTDIQTRARARILMAVSAAGTLIPRLSRLTGSSVAIRTGSFIRARKLS